MHAVFRWRSSFSRFSVSDKNAFLTRLCMLFNVRGWLLKKSCIIEIFGVRMNSFIQRKKAKHMNERSFLPGLFLFESASVNDALFCRMEGMLLETRREREMRKKRAGTLDALSYFWMRRDRFDWTNWRRRASPKKLLNVMRFIDCPETRLRAEKTLLCAEWKKKKRETERRVESKARAD